MKLKSICLICNIVLVAFQSICNYYKLVCVIFCLIYGNEMTLFLIEKSDMQSILKLPFVFRYNFSYFLFNPDKCIVNFSPIEMRSFNDQMMYFDRVFIDPLGLPGRPNTKWVTKPNFYFSKLNHWAKVVQTCSKSSASSIIMNKKVWNNIDGTNQNL